MIINLYMQITKKVKNDDCHYQNKVEHTTQTIKRPHLIYSKWKNFIQYITKLSKCLIEFETNNIK